jgi:hypothetical protein
MTTIAESKTIETWAEAKGYLPEWQTIPARLGPHRTTTRKQNPKFVRFAMAKAHRRWPEGFEVTEEEFDLAVQEAAGVTLV